MFHVSVVCIGEIKACPRCGALIVKMDDGSCNHMTCTVCAAEFCWLCMQEISDIHYLRYATTSVFFLEPVTIEKNLMAYFSKTNDQLIVGFDRN